MEAGDVLDVAQEGCLQDQKDESIRLFEDYKRTRDDRIRDRLAVLYQGLVRLIAGKFVSRGEPVEDLISVGNIGLLNAIDRYDPERGVAFTAYATPTIAGEIKRHFRDHCWKMKMPRKLQELIGSILKETDSLSHKLSRKPTAVELAVAVGSDEEDVLEALETIRELEVLSLDSPMASGESAPLCLAELHGKQDPRIQEIQSHGDVFHAIACLDSRLGQIIFEIYFEDKSQVEVASILGISQMTVSRSLRKALQQLKVLLEEEPTE